MYVLSTIGRRFPRKDLILIQLAEFRSINNEFGMSNVGQFEHNSDAHSNNVTLLYITLQCTYSKPRFRARRMLIKR